MEAIYFFEDEKTKALAPLLTWNNPWDLLFGAFTLRQRAEQLFPQQKVEGVRRGATPALPTGQVLFINCRVLNLDGLLGAESLSDSAWYYKDELAAVLCSPQNWQEDLSIALARQAATLPRQEWGSPLIEDFWDLVHGNAQQLQADGAQFNLGEHQGVVHERATLLAPEHIFIGQGVGIAPGAVLDARKGPIILGEGVTVGANAVINGPFYAGKEVTVNPLTLIRPDVSLGAGCKVGGELRTSIMLNNSAKAHYGYLGCSYVGAWCNLAAGSTTSNIKNTYGDISLEDGTSSGQHSLGSLIGDHVKVGSNTVLSPGSKIGAFSNVFGAGAVPRDLSPFSWYDASAGTREDFALDKAIEVADRVLGRRGQTLTEDQKKNMSDLFSQQR